MSDSNTTPYGATVVITRRVRDGAEADYDRWLDEIGPACRALPGHLDWHLVRPVPGLTTTYTVIRDVGDEPRLVEHAGCDVHSLLPHPEHL